MANKIWTLLRHTDELSNMFAKRQYGTEYTCNNCKMEVCNQCNDTYCSSPEYTLKCVDLPLAKHILTSIFPLSTQVRFFEIWNHKHNHDRAHIRKHT